MLGARDIKLPLSLLLIYIPYIYAGPSSKEARSNPLNIDWDPAPSPEDGPPLSAHASRNKALLPYQISGIVGAYLLTVCFVGVTLLCINKRIRRQLQQSVKALDIELVPGTQYSFSQTTTNYDPSPISPGLRLNTQSPRSPHSHTRNFSWPSPEKTEPNPYVFPATYKYPPLSIPANGNPFVDHRVVEADREMLNRDLEDIYAHVMEQEEAKAKGIVLKDPPTPIRSPVSATSATPPSPEQANTLQKKPSKVWSRRSDKPANLNLEGDDSKSHSRSSSILSALRSPRRKQKPMQISSPMPTPLSATFPSSNSDEEPLTPRYYQPPPPPPVPKDQVPYTHVRKSSQMSMQPPLSPTRSIAEQLSSYPTDPRQPGHLQTDSRTSTIRSSQVSRDPVSATSTNSTTPLFPTNYQPPQSPQQQRAPAPQPLASNPSRSLPFRAFEPSGPLSPSFVTQTTKTTVLERTNPLSPGLNSGLKTPWSAGAVPYSPYQPFTPVMPMTPTLVTKKERKAREKEEKKRRGPVLELIKSEDELWDSGY